MQKLQRNLNQTVRNTEAKSCKLLKKNHEETEERPWEKLNKDHDNNIIKTAMEWGHYNEEYLKQKSWKNYLKF